MHSATSFRPTSGAVSLADEIGASMISMNLLDAEPDLAGPEL